MSPTEERFYRYAVGKARYRDHTYFGADGVAAAELGVSRRTIIRCRHSLEAKGWLTRCGEHRWGPRKTTVCYRFPRRRVTQRTSYRTTSRTRTRNYVPCSSAKAPKRRFRMTEGQRLVAFYVDECIEQSANRMLTMKGHVSRRAKELLDTLKEHPEAIEGRDPVQAVQEALAEFVRRRSKTPLALAEIMSELESNRSLVVSERADVRRQANEWVETHGWPTGARFVRGTHSGTYVYDPLGLERLPPGYGDWPHPKPTFDDICIALAE